LLSDSYEHKNFEVVLRRKQRLAALMD
jgi:hypothetical protein